MIRAAHTPPAPSRLKHRTRARGYITRDRLTNSTVARAVRADLIDRLNQHSREGTLPRGPRGLFYDLRPEGNPGHPRGVHYRKQGDTKNGVATPKYVQEQLEELRRVLVDGEPMIPEDWISDGRVPDPVEPYELADGDAFGEQITALIEASQLQRQDGQPVHLEVWCEAADLMPRVARICGDRGITVFSGSGTDGLKAQKAVADRAARRAVQTIVGHIGDRDKHGEDMYDALAENCLNSWQLTGARAGPPRPAIWNSAGWR